MAHQDRSEFRNLKDFKVSQTCTTTINGKRTSFAKEWLNLSFIVQLTNFASLRSLANYSDVDLMNGFHSFFLGLQNFFGSSKIRNYLDIITCKWQLRDDLQIRQLLFKFKEMNPKLGKEPQF